LDIKTVFLYGGLEEDIYMMYSQVYHAKKRAVGLQAQEEFLWFETGSEVVVSEFQKIHD